jgi:hypothetical protein
MNVFNHDHLSQTGQSAGIDKVSLWIHPYLIRQYSEFHYRGNNNANVILRHSIYNGYSIDFQSEFFNLDDNFFIKIFDYLIRLSNNGILKSPPNKDIEMVKNSFITLFNYFFALDCIEFYFDIRENDLMLSEALNPRYKESRYSDPYSKERKSILISYDRIERAKKVNRLSHDEIILMPYPWRIEFKLKRRNCEYLNSENIFGSYDTIFQRYLFFLAKRWRSYGNQVAEVPYWNSLTYNKYFSKIVETSHGQLQPSGMYLKRTPPCPMPNKSVKIKDVDKNWAIQFSIMDWI